MAATLRVKACERAFRTLALLLVQPCERPETFTMAVADTDLLRASRGQAIQIKSGFKRLNSNEDLRQYSLARCNDSRVSLLCPAARQSVTRAHAHATCHHGDPPWGDCRGAQQLLHRPGALSCDASANAACMFHGAKSCVCMTGPCQGCKFAQLEKPACASTCGPAHLGKCAGTES